MSRRPPHRVNQEQTWHDTAAYRRGYRDASGRGMDSGSAGVGGRGPAAGGGGGGGGCGGGCGLFLIALAAASVVTLAGVAGLGWWVA